MIDGDIVLRFLAFWSVPILMAITLHEAAHGWAAWKLGDDTAFRLKRVTFNPIRHIDPVGTILLPAMLVAFTGGKMVFGFAKPVPVNFMRLRRPRRDMILVAAAGPGTNVLLAVASAIAILAMPLLSPGFGELVETNLRNSIFLNCILAVFNMLPIPPLDGGRVAVGLLPRRLALPLARLEKAGFFIIIGLFFLLPWLAGKLGVTVTLSYWLILLPALHLNDLILFGLGLPIAPPWGAF